MVKNVLVIQETQVQSLCQNDPLEEMASHSSIPVWEIPRNKGPGRLNSAWGHRTVGHDLATKQQC